MQMNNTRKILFALLLVGGLAVATLFFVAADGNKPFLPGLTSSDNHPNGCVDCHKVSGDNDERLNVEIAKVEDHPKIDAIVKTAPKDCLMCHKEGAKAGPLSLIVHKAHYHNPAENHFIQFYQGACLNCHSVNPGSGKMTVKNGPKNW